MSPRTRWALLIALLALSAGLVLFGDAPPSDAAPVVDATPADLPRSGTATETPARASAVTILEIVLRAPSTVPADAFAVRDWTPPPPPPPPAPPMAPPLPFTYLGKKQQDGAWVVFLGRQDETYIVKASDAIDSLYRVEAVSPPSMTITYLPLQQQQTLAIGEP